MYLLTCLSKLGLWAIGLAVVVAGSARAQYIDDLSGVSGSGRQWQLNHAVAGELTVQYSNSGWYLSTAPTNAWAGTTSFDHGNSGTDDYVDFSWDNAVSHFDFTLWDWDGGGSVPSDFRFTNGVDRVYMVGFGESLLNDPGFDKDTYTVSGDTISYDGSLGDITNSDPGNGLRIRVQRADGASFTSFRMQMVDGYSYNGFGGNEPTAIGIPEDYVGAVPEPGSALLVLVGGMSLLFTRGRK